MIRSSRADLRWIVSGEREALQDYRAEQALDRVLLQADLLKEVSTVVLAGYGRRSGRLGDTVSVR